MSEGGKKRHIGRHACERCRAAKVRCLLDTFEDHGKCRRCHTTDVECEWKAISKTRNRKRTDARVSELERQLSTLTATLQSSPNVSGSDGARVEALPGEANIEPVAPTASNRSLQLSSAGTSPFGAPTVSANATLDNSSLLQDKSTQVLQNTSAPWSVARSPLIALSTNTKKQIIDDFVTHLLPQFPVVAVPENSSLVQLEESRPFMTRAIIAAGCSVSEPAIFETIHHENVALLSESVLTHGLKSLDLVQALLVTAIWGHPPQDLNNLTMYQWTHMACTMAMELGLGGRTSFYAQRQDVNEFSYDHTEPMMERYRTMFGVYIMCSRLAVSFRRQRMMSFSLSTPIAIDLFQQHAHSINDRRLLAWLRLQAIAEEVESMKQNAEMEAELMFADSNSVRSDISVFHDRLKAWEDQVDTMLWTDSLKIELGFCGCKIREFSIYCGRHIQQLDLPDLNASAEASSDEQRKPISPGFVRDLLSFVAGCHTILDVFLRANHATLRALPTLTIFRAPFAFKALAMLRARSMKPDEDIRQIIDEESLRWKFYSNGVTQSLEGASAGRVYVFPTLALRIKEAVQWNKYARSLHHDIHENQPSHGGLDQISTDLPEMFVGNSAAVDDGLRPNQAVSEAHVAPMSYQEDSNLWRYDFLDFDI